MENLLKIYFTTIYSPFSEVFNKQKKLRDKSFITELLSVKTFIILPVLIKNHILKRRSASERESFISIASLSTICFGSVFMPSFIQSSMMPMNM